MKKFRYIDHAGDLGVAVFGDSLGCLFVNAGQAFADILTDIQTIERRQSLEISLEAGRIEDLLVHWFNELIFLFDTKGLLFSGFDIRFINACHIQAEIHGERYDDTRHTIKTIVKSATYHRLEVLRQNDIWKAVVIFDL